MKTKLLVSICLFLLSTAAIAQYKTALPGYSYQFPRDHFSHPDYQTEWWYYTGNLTAADGRRYGFELTFFRQGIPNVNENNSAWAAHDLFLAHLALSDLDGGNFYHTERVNRAGPGIAGVDATRQLIWNGNWSTAWIGEDQQLSAVDERFAINLRLHPEKPLVIHGVDGVSQKSAGVGQASHYISYTRLRTSGTLEINGRSIVVIGTSWMDHEFFTHQLESTQAGWDWMSIQLQDGTELMLYEIRRKDGSVDPFSSGTYIDGGGHATHLMAGDIQMHPAGEIWKSPITGATYPVSWTVSIPKLDLHLKETTRLKSQELSGKSSLSPNYWEGAVEFTGTRGAASVSGVGYLEMTGYDHALRFGQ